MGQARSLTEDIVQDSIDRSNYEDDTGGYREETYDGMLLSAWDLCISRSRGMTL